VVSWRDEKRGSRDYVGNGVTSVKIDATAGGAVRLAGPERALAAINGLNEPETLRQARRLAWERFRELPMPTRKSEEWRYTDISSLRLEDYEPAIPGLNGERPDGPEHAGLDDLEAVPEPVREVLARSQERSGVWVQVDGVTVYHRLDDDLAERGVVFASISTVARERPDLLEKYLFTSPIPEMEEKLWAAHVALLSEGFVLHVPRGVRLPTPIHTFRCITKPGILVSTHSLVAVEEGGAATCIDEFMSPDLPEPSINLAGAELFGGPEATLHYIAIQRFGTGVKHFGLQHVTSERDSRLAGVNISLGGDLSRADVTSHLEGSGSESQMLALWFGDRTQHFDHHTLQHHAARSAHSDLGAGRSADGRVPDQPQPHPERQGQRPGASEPRDRGGRRPLLSWSDGGSGGLEAALLPYESGAEPPAGRAASGVRILRRGPGTHPLGGCARPNPRSDRSEDRHQPVTESVESRSA
jgi:Fe-S cluster assembly protein SufD